MKQEHYRRHLVAVEGCDEEFAEWHSEELYTMAERDLMLDIAMDPNDTRYGVDLLLRYLPALLEDHDPAHLLRLIDAKRDVIFSARDAARQTLRHLEIIADHADMGIQARLIEALTTAKRLRNDPMTALEFGKQFGKILRHFDSPANTRVVRQIWDVIACYRALPPVLSFIAPEELPDYLDRGPIEEATSARVVASDMVTPRRYLDPTDKGECDNAEVFHQRALADHGDGYGRLTIVEADDGTPVGSIKWDGYPSMLGLRTVIDGAGRHSVMPGGVYKLSERVERDVLDDENLGQRFARRRYAELELQPVRMLGGYWPGRLDHEEFRDIIDDVLTRPEFRKHG